MTLSPYLKKYIRLLRTYTFGEWVKSAYRKEKGNPLSEGSVANKWKGYILLSIHIYAHSFKFHSSSTAKIKVYNYIPFLQRCQVVYPANLMI